MKRAVCFALGFLMLFASAAVGQTLTQKGVSVMLSVGDEKRPIEALMVFTDQTGAILTPNEGMLLVPQGESVGVQIFPKGARGDKSFIIGYSTETLMPKSPKRADFDPIYGWRFVLTPQEMEQAPCLVRALQVAVTNRDGRKSWIRVIFKITYGSGWLTQYDQLIIKTVPRSEMNQSGGTSGSDASAAVDALVANQQKTTEYIGKLESRVTNLENWAGSATGSNSASANLAQMVTLPVNFTGNFTNIGLRVTRPDGKVDDYVVKTAGVSLNLSMGSNIFDLLVDYGNGVVKKKKPINVVVDSTTKLITIDVGGAGR